MADYKNNHYRQKAYTRKWFPGSSAFNKNKDINKDIHPIRNDNSNSPFKADHLYGVKLEQEFFSTIHEPNLNKITTFLTNLKMGYHNLPLIHHINENIEIFFTNKMHIKEFFTPKFLGWRYLTVFHILIEQFRDPKSKCSVPEEWTNINQRSLNIWQQPLMLEPWIIENKKQIKRFIQHMMDTWKVPDSWIFIVIEMALTMTPIIAGYIELRVPDSGDVHFICNDAQFTNSFNGFWQVPLSDSLLFTSHDINVDTTKYHQTILKKLITQNEVINIVNTNTFYSAKKYVVGKKLMIQQAYYAALYQRKKNLIEYTNPSNYLVNWLTNNDQLWLLYK